MACYRDVTKKDGETPEQFLDIFREFDFTCIEQECDLFCPECRNVRTCAIYSDFADDWELFYT